MNVFVVYAKRTPFGKIRGQLSTLRPDDLLALLMKDFLAQQWFAPHLIDDIIIGCANQAGEDNRNIARMSALLANIPFSVPAMTVNRLCASGLDAIWDGVCRIKAEQASAILVGGVESMSRAPLVLAKAERAWSGNQKIYDTSIGWRFPNKEMAKIFPLLSMGETAELLAQKFAITRLEQDQFALASHHKAIFAQEQGSLKSEIIPINNGQQWIENDEHPRSDTSLEKLAQLPTIFGSPGTITAGNACGMSDGACLLLLATGQFIQDHQLTPLAEITGAGIKGLHPSEMGLGPVVAVNELCRRWHKNLRDFQRIEINEAFAAQALACIKALDLDPAIVNVQGGAIALGHPLGASGARLVASIAHQFHRSPTMNNALVSACVGVGQGMAISLARA